MIARFRDFDNAKIRSVQIIIQISNSKVQKIVFVIIFYT